MNAYRDHEFGCHLHPQEMVIGVCALCLRERLLILASTQSEAASLHKNKATSFRADIRRKHSLALPKVFALSSFLTRLDSRRHPPDDYSDELSIGSFDDSFISIKFEDNGKASWDNKKVVNTKPAIIMEKEKQEVKSVVEHSKRGGMLRWRKQIGRLLHLSRWRRSGKAGACPAGINGKVEGVKVRRGWMRSLTKRRATSVD